MVRPTPYVVLDQGVFAMRAGFPSARPHRFGWLAATLAAVTLGLVVAGAGATSAFAADGSPAASAAPTVSISPALVTCTATPHISYGWDGANAFAAKLTSGLAPCYDVIVNLTSYQLPATWDGKGFDASAAPQTEYATTTLTFPAYRTAEVSATVPAPSCGSYQADAYAGDVQTSVSYPAGTAGYLAGNIVYRAPCPTPDVSAGPAFTDATCASSTAGYTLPQTTGVDYFARVDTGSAVAATAGSFVPVTAGHSVVLTAVAAPGYPALLGYPAAGWTHTFPTPGVNCSATPAPTTQTVVIAPVSAVPTGTVTESCTTGGGDESYTVTLVNPAATTSAPVEFRVSVNGGVAATSAAVASGASYTDPGALPNGASASFGADYRAVGATAWTPVVLTEQQLAFPCAAVQGEQFVKPTVVTPTVVTPTAVQPVAVVAPLATKKSAATLPFTGLPTIPTALIALTLVAVGGLLVFLARRRETGLT
jgi:hypothetical protein